MGTSCCGLGVTVFGWCAGSVLTLFQMSACCENNASEERNAISSSDDLIPSLLHVWGLLSCTVAFSVSPCEIIGDSKCLIFCRSRQCPVSTPYGMSCPVRIMAGFPQLLAASLD